MNIQVDAPVLLPIEMLSYKVLVIFSLEPKVIHAFRKCRCLGEPGMLRLETPASKTGIFFTYAQMRKVFQEVRRYKCVVQVKDVRFPRGFFTCSKREIGQKPILLNKFYWHS